MQFSTYAIDASRVKICFTEISKQHIHKNVFTAAGLVRVAAN